MNRTYAGVSCVAAVLLACETAAQEWQWLNTGGGSADDEAWALCAAGQTNVFVVGAFGGAARFGETSLEVAGHTDAFVARYEPDGRLARIQQFGGDDEERATGVVAAGDDHIAVVGTFRSASLQCGDFTLTNRFALTNFTDFQFPSLFLARLRLDGTVDWARQVEGISSTRQGIGADAAGNIYVVGSMQRQARFAETNLFGYEDIVLAKFDAAGQLQWVRQAGSNGYEYAGALAVGGDGTVYLTGRFEREMEFGERRLQTRGSTDIFLARYDADGTFGWADAIGGPLPDQDGGLAVAPDGGVLVTGGFWSSATVGTNVLTAAGPGADLFFAWYDRPGAVRWARAVGGAGAESPGDVRAVVTLGPSGAVTNLFLTGGFDTQTQVGRFGLTNGAAPSAFVSSWDAQGEVQWAQWFGARTASLCVSTPSAAAPILCLAGAFGPTGAWSTTQEPSRGGTDCYVGALATAAAPATVALPVVTAAPVSLQIARGLAAAFQVRVQGVGPMTYRWRKDGRDLTDAERVSGAATARLAVRSVQANDAGRYSVTVRNPAGAVVSAEATLGVQEPSPASGPAWSWVRTLGGARSDAVSCLAADGSGGAYVAGTFSLTNTLGDLTLVNPLSQPAIFTAHYDAQGLSRWARMLSGAKLNTPVRVATTPAGDVLVAGNFESAELAGDGVLLTNAAPGDADIFMVRYDAQGAVLEAQRFGSDRDDACHDLAVDAAGNRYLVGEFSSGSLAFGDLRVANRGGHEVFLVKFDAQGAPRWVRTAGDSGFHEGRAVAVDPAGNVFISGAVYGAARFGEVELNSLQDVDGFVASYTSDGALRWVRQMTSRSVLVGNVLAANPAGELYVGGYFDQSFTFDRQRVLARGGQDVFLAKLSARGDALWVRGFGGPGTDGPARLAVDGAGNAILAGRFQQRAEFGDCVVITGAASDGFVAAVSPVGQVLWAKQAGGSRGDDAQALALDLSGAILLGGQFQGSAAFDPALYAAVESSVDGWLARLDPERPLAPASLAWARAPGSLWLAGALGSTVAVQRAARLEPPVTWLTVTNLILTASPHPWIDPASGADASRFYRAQTVSAGAPLAP